MKFNCKIYLEAEDVAQSRILSTTSYVKNLIANCNNSYISRLEIDDENDLDDFIIRLYAEAEIIEDTVTDEKAAEMLAPHLAELLTEIAQAQSYLDMEGSFQVEYQELKEAYTFKSEQGDSFCDFDFAEAE